MSLAVSPAQVEDALRESGHGWVLDYWGNDQDKHVQGIAAKIEEFAAAYEKEFGETPDPFQLLKVNPTKGAAFFQITTFSVSLRMRIMIWRILQGCRITKVDFKYEFDTPTHLAVTLETPDRNTDGPYVGSHPYDFRVLRSFGIVGVNDELVLDGYYAHQS